MSITGKKYHALISADWNECLAPSNPFDPIIRRYPIFQAEIKQLFAAYTRNLISLESVNRRILELLPAPISLQQMNDYIDRDFITYPHVPDLMQWCLDNGILFMINTTGVHGYFQCLLAKGLLPPGIAVAANPLIQYPETVSSGYHAYDILSLEDKGKSTGNLMQALDIPPSQVIVIGDSGGDGPHFKWGASVQATLIGSMSKPSLKDYCGQHGIKIKHEFGVSYAAGEPRDLSREMQVDFMELIPVIRTALGMDGKP